MNIILLDDSKMFATLLRGELESVGIEELSINHFNNFAQALDYSKNEVVDLIVSEVHFKSGEKKGFDFLKAVRKQYNLRNTPFVFISTERASSLIKEAFMYGANDFLYKPLEPLAFFKLKNLVETATQNRKVREKMLTLSTGMDEAIEVVKEREREIIFRLAKAAATRDKETGNHIYRVGKYSFVLAKTLGLPFHMQEMIEKSSPLHDVGKIAIPDAILQKPGKLTDEEFKIMKNHTIYGYKILYNPNMELLKMASDVALSHHERWDGKGYPYGKKGEEIPVAARITTVADVFDAFTSRRRYKSAWSVDDSFKGLTDEAGTAFDRDVVEALIECRDEILAIHEELKDDD